MAAGVDRAAIQVDSSFLLLSACAGAVADSRHVPESRRNIQNQILEANNEYVPTLHTMKISSYSMTEAPSKTQLPLGLKVLSWIWPPFVVWWNHSVA